MSKEKNPRRNFYSGIVTHPRWPKRADSLAHGPIFEEYDRPGRALQVWESYFPEIADSGLIDEAREIAGRLRKAESLDSELYRLLTPSDQRSHTVIRDEEEDCCEQTGVHALAGQVEKAQETNQF